MAVGRVQPLNCASTSWVNGIVLATLERVDLPVLGVGRVAFVEHHLAAPEAAPAGTGQRFTPVGFVQHIEQWEVRGNCVARPRASCSPPGAVTSAGR